MSNEEAEKPMLGRLSRQVKHMPINATVTITPDLNSNNHILEIIAGDRPGLLSTLAQTFLQQGIHLQTAKINTLGKRAEDTFLICARDGKCLAEKEITSLKQVLSDRF